MRISKQLDASCRGSQAADLKASRKLHPEDIRIGDDVAVSEVSYQYASFHWFGVDSTLLPPQELVSLTYYPSDSFEPLKVLSVCLPFVLCKQINAKHTVFDLRRIQLVRLDPGFAKQVRQAFKADKSNRKSKQKSDKEKSKRRKSSK